MHKEDTQVLVAMRDTFEGAPLTTLEWKGRPCWVAGEIDRALGLPDNLSGSRWAARSKDYREGADGEQVTGEVLDALKAAGLVGANAPNATVFYESGATLYLMASRAKKARAFRWRLVDVVLPALRERAAPLSIAQDDRPLGSRYGSDVLKVELRRARLREKAERMRLDAAARDARRAAAYARMELARIPR